MSPAADFVGSEESSAAVSSSEGGLPLFESFPGLPNRFIIQQVSAGANDISGNHPHICKSLWRERQQPGEVLTPFLKSKSNSYAVLSIAVRDVLSEVKESREKVCKLCCGQSQGLHPLGETVCSGSLNKGYTFEMKVQRRSRKAPRSHISV